MSEVKRKLKRLLTFVLAGVLLLQSTLVYASASDYEATFRSNVYNPFDSYGGSGHNGRYLMADSSTGNILTGIGSTYYKWIEIKVGVVDPDKYPGVQFQNNYYNEINALKSSKSQEDVKNLLQWSDYNSAVDEGKSTASSYEYDYIDDLYSTIGNMGMNKLTAIKPGYTLLAWVVTKPYESSMRVYYDDYVYIDYFEIAPIFAEDEAYYGTYTTISTDSPSKLYPGSIIFSEKLSGIMYGQDANSSVYLYVDEGEYANLLDLGHLSSNFTRTSLVSVCVPSTYKGQQVEYWDVLAIEGGDEFFGRITGSPFPSRQVSNNDGINIVTETRQHMTGYVGYYNKYIKLSPVYKQTTINAKNPNVTLDGYELKLTSNAPVDSDGTTHDEMLSDVVDKFYVTANTETESINDSQLIQYDSSSKYILHPGTYKVFTKSTCSGADDSEIASVIITVGAPVLEKPGVVSSIENKRVTYTQPTTIGTTDNSNGTSYQSEVTNQNVIIKTSDTKNVQPETVKQQGQISQYNTQTSLNVGYNVILAINTLELPASMPVDGSSSPAVRYYSDMVTEVVYIPYNLEAPIVDDDDTTFTIDYGGNESRNKNAKRKYVYKSVSDKDDYDSKSIEELSEEAEEYNDAIPKKDGISVVYTYVEYEERVDDGTYVSRSEITKEVITKEYDIEDPVITVEDEYIEIESGGYSSEPDEEYDKSTIYYIITDSEEPPTEEDLIKEENKYTDKIPRERKGGYIHAIEVLESDDGETHLVSKSDIVTREIDEIPSTISYDANEGVFINATFRSKQLKYGDAYGSFPMVDRTGYTLAGWYDDKDNGTEVTAATTKNDYDDETLYAHWNENHYYIKFDGNGASGEMSTLNPSYTESVVLPDSEFQWDDHKFLGWSTESDAKFEKYTAGTSVSKLSSLNNHTVTLYAIWEDNSTPYTPIYIYFDANEGTVSLDKKEIKQGEMYGELPLATRDEYRFLGWFESKDEGSAQRLASQIKEDNADETVYAHWEKIVEIPDETHIYVTFNPNGGECSINKKEVYQGQAYGELPIPTYAHHNFLGWFTEELGGTEVKSIHIKQDDKDEVLYAHWSEFQYTIEFDPNGGTGTMDSMKMYYSDRKPLTLNKFTNGDKKFAGWSKQQNTVIVQYTDGETVGQLSELDNGTVKLYAIWKDETNVDEAIVSFDPNGGKCSTESITVQIGNPYGTLPIATRTGYDFLGWYTDIDGGTQVTAISIKSTPGDETLYAHWDEHSYTIEFNANGGKGEMESIQVLYSEKIELPKNTFTYKNKTFVGWNTDSKAIKKKYSNKEKVSMLTDKDGDTVTLYAIWAKVDSTPTTPTPTPPTETKPVVTVTQAAPATVKPVITKIIENVKTGDSREMNLWLLVMIAGLCVIVGPEFMKRKKLK